MATCDSGSKLELPKKPPPKEMRADFHLTASQQPLMPLPNCQDLGSAIFPIKKKNQRTMFFVKPASVSMET